MARARFDVATTFEVDVPPGVEVPGNETAGAFVPRRSPRYRFRKETLSDVLAWHTRGAVWGPLFLSGPTQCGKSSLMRQIAARLNFPVQIGNGNARLEVKELIGGFQLIGGDTLWVDGPLTTAVCLGHWFLYEEGDSVDPGENLRLHTVLDGEPLVIAENGGEVVEPHPDFRFVLLGNTRGGGDLTGNYAGTVRQSMAFVNRFAVVEMDYPEPLHETQIVRERVPDLSGEAVGRMVNVANAIRRLFKGEADGDPIEVTMSTGALLRWADMTWFFQGLEAHGVNPYAHALDRAMGFTAEPETRVALHEIVRAEFGEAGDIPVAGAGASAGDASGGEP
ncbi:MAG: AAA family ATPase [Pseudomonadota bacterium]|nr:AAA family ATPase [Pseudomonadota bacterium]